MNGSLHLGHAFTISKIEFGAGFERMRGKKVLFPVGFHVVSKVPHFSKMRSTPSGESPWTALECALT